MTETRDDGLGRVIGGEYEVLEETGRGAFGAVFRCRETTLGKIVALKILKVEIANERVVDAFLKEGRKLAALNHPNVVQVFRAGVHEHRPYMVMEYVDGRTVRQLVQGGALPVGTALDIMTQVARGLQAIHSCGIIHRDLSSNNVMVTLQGTAKILDLGLARFADATVSASSSDRIVGTLPYLAPETTTGRRPGPAADVFSLGVLLYETIAGRRPFDGDTPHQILRSLLTHEPVPLDQVVPSLPSRLVRLVEQCLCKNPDDRPTDLADLADRIAASALELTSPGAVPIPTGPRPDPTRGSTPNPYHNRSMIRHAGEFIGRVADVRRIYSRLDSSPPGCVSIVGDRRIGKSSLLSYLHMKATRDALLAEPDSLVMVFLDLQAHQDVSLESFMREVMTLVAAETGGSSLVEQLPPTFEGMRQMAQRVSAERRRLAILLDEFEVVTRNPNFTLEFFSFLRSLANQYDVGYITSSVRDLQTLCHTREIASSPFFNIFSTLKLTAFSEADARALVSLPSQRAGFPLESWYEFLVDELAGRFPFFLQIGCYHLFESVRDAESGTVPLDDVRRRYRDEVEPHYRFLWKSFDDHERVVVERIVRQRGVPESLRDVQRELGARGYILVDGTEGRLFSRTFRDFVLAELDRSSRGWSWQGLLGRKSGT